jgi:two-component system, OmpR family, sensor kinase
MSIRLRLTLWYSGLLAVLLVAVGIIVYSVVYNNTMSDLRDRLRQEAEQIRVSGSFFSGGIDLNASIPEGIDVNTIGVQVINYTEDPKGIVSGKTNNLVRWNITYPYPQFSEAQHRFVSRQVQDYPFLLYEQPIQLGKNKIVGLLQVGAFTGREELFFSQLRTILWISGTAGLVAAFWLGMILSRQALRPLNRVTEAAEQIQSGSELGLRIPREKSNDEIGRLTDTLNGMLSGLERAYKTLEDSNIAQRRFVSDASHELRTPLTTIRGNIDLLEKIWSDEPRQVELEPSSGNALSPGDKQQMSLESIRDIADEARRMSRLVNDLLALARADAGYVMEMENLPLRPLAEEAARRAAFLPRNAEWVAGPFDALEGIWVRGNRDYLLQLLFILIENGFKYTPSGQVRLTAALLESHVGLIVSDTGIGLSPEEVPHIFQRFYRADVSRGETSGTGLGLSIAKWIADMHDSRLEVRSKHGEGTAFTVWLPITAVQYSE